MLIYIIVYTVIFGKKIYTHMHRMGQKTVNRLIKFTIIYLRSLLLA
jgi:hypothetical protein